MSSVSSKKTQSNPPVALVTGAPGSIGPAICRDLKNAGYRVAATARSADSFRIAEGYKEKVPRDGEYYADLQDTNSYERLVREVEADLGPLSLLVNNAAYDGKGAALQDMSQELYHTFMNINLTAPYFLTKAALPSLSANRGSVINISSVLCQTFMPLKVVYAMSKIALEKMTEGLAWELAGSGVRVNCIRVGAVQNTVFLEPVLKSLPAEDARRLYEHVMPDHRVGYHSQEPPRYLGYSEDISRAVMFLVGEEAEYINGATIPVDGLFAFRRGTSKVPVMKRTCERTRDWLIAEGREDLVPLLAQMLD